MEIDWPLFRHTRETLQILGETHSLNVDVIACIMKNTVLLYYCTGEDYYRRFNVSLEKRGEMVTFIYTGPMLTHEKGIIYRAKNKSLEEYLVRDITNITIRGISIVPLDHVVVHYFNRNQETEGREIITDKHISPGLYGEVMMETVRVMKYIDMIRNDLYIMSTLSSVDQKLYYPILTYMVAKEDKTRMFGQ